MLIEQAIFTSAKTDRAQGYQLLSRSPHLSEADARELSLWGPSHGSLLEQPGEPDSANFFPLTSGAYCVSRTTIAGAEYSGRGGDSIYTQYLVVPPEVLRRFANNPFAILRAAAASGALYVADPVPEELPAIPLVGRAPVVDLGLLAQLARDPGPAAMATLVQTALASERIAIYCDSQCEQLVAGLFNLLPVECRTEYPFSTGLKHAPNRPVRVLALPGDPAAARALARQGFTLLRLDESCGADLAWDGWAGWIASILSSGKLSALASELEQARPGLTTADLDALGEKIQANAPGRRPAPPAASPPRSSSGEESAQREPAPAPQFSARTDMAHAAPQSGLVLDVPRAAELDSLADKLAHQPVEILEMLEHVDDLVFAAISGDEQALAELEVVWPLTASELDPDLVEQSREQYLRCALAICGDFTEGELRRPERAIAAIDVLSVLFEE